MKPTLPLAAFVSLALLAGLACRLSAAPSPAAAPTEPPVARAAVTAPPASATPPLPAATPSPAPSPTPDLPAEPAIAERYALSTSEIGFGLNVLAAGGRIWEIASAGVRVFQPEGHVLDREIPLENRGGMFARLAADADHLYALFYSPAAGMGPADLYCLSLANDDPPVRVDLPDGCPQGECVWQSLLAVDGRLWVGGEGVLAAYDPATLERLGLYDLTAQQVSREPMAVLDIEAPRPGQLWLLMNGDPRFVAALDSAALLADEPALSGFIDFTLDTNPEWLVNADGVLWAGIPANSYSETQQQARLARLDQLDTEIGVEGVVSLPAGADLFTTPDSAIFDGARLWAIDASTRQLHWLDPARGELLGTLEVYPGSEPTAEDPNVIFSLTSDGRHLWTAGTEVLRIALPWAPR